MGQGLIIIESIKRDVIHHLSVSGGGSFRAILIAPNTQVQYSNVIASLMYVQLHPFVQESLVQLPQGSALATMGIIMDKSITAGIPIHLVPPALPLRAAFN